MVGIIGEREWIPGGFHQSTTHPNLPNITSQYLSMVFGISQMITFIKVEYPLCCSMWLLTLQSSCHFGQITIKRWFYLSFCSPFGGSALVCKCKGFKIELTFQDLNIKWTLKWVNPIPNGSHLLFWFVFVLLSSLLVFYPLTSFSPLPFLLLCHSLFLPLLLMSPTLW